jgi:hypothetical protein
VNALKAALMGSSSGLEAVQKQSEWQDTDEALENGWTRSTRRRPDGLICSWSWKRQPGYPKQIGCGTYDSVTIAQQSMVLA